MIKVQQLLTLGLMAWSATALASGDPLTLTDAVELAVTLAPDLSARQSRVEAAEALVIPAGRLPDPQLIAGVENLPSNGVDAWSVGRDFMTMRKVGLMQSFPSQAKRRSEKDSAQAMVFLAESQATQSRLEVTQSVAQAWAARYAAEVSLKTLQDLRPELTLQVDLANAAVAGASASPSDALSARAAVADLDDRILEAQREVAGTRAELTRWIGDAADRPLASPPAFRGLSVSDTELLSSLHHHAALLTYDAQIAAAQSEIAVATAAKRPDWSAELDYARRGPGFSDLVTLQFSVSLPLFSSTRQDPLIHAKRAAVRELEADRENELRMHTAEITTMLSDWHSAKDRVDLYEAERLPLARQRSELALAGLRAGRMDVRQTLAVLSDELAIEHSYAEQLKTLGKTWAYLHYLSSRGVVQ
jgi:cobalt-zinc-cadmium efflux system outer membrane protein